MNENVTPGNGLAVKELSTASRIPYLSHVDNSTLRTESGDLIKIFRLKGTPYQTANTEELNQWDNQRHRALKAIKSSSISIWTHTIKKKAESNEVKGLTGIAKEVIDKYNKDCVGTDLYTTEFYLSIVYRPGLTGVKTIDWFKGLFSSAKASELNERSNSKIKRQLSEFDNISSDFISKYSIYSPEPLTTYTKGKVLYSKALSFLSYIVNGDTNEQPVYSSRIKNYLGKHRISFGKDIGVIEKPNGEQFFGMLGVNEYNNRTYPGLLDKLLTFSGEIVISQSFSFIPKNQAIESLKRQLNHLDAAEDDAKTLYGQLESAIDSIASGEFGFGNHDLHILYKSQDKAIISKQLAEMASLITEAADAKREDLALESSYWAQLPGNFKYITRAAGITTENFAHFESLHGFPQGNDKPYWGSPLLLMKTDTNTPYYFNFHVEDLGNTTFIGPSGSGKTTLMTMLMLGAEQYSPTQIYFDKDRGAEPAVRAIGGKYTLLKRGAPTGFNPLQMEDDTKGYNRAFLYDLFRQCCLLTIGEFNHSDSVDLTQALKFTFQLPKENRVLEALWGFLPFRSDGYIKKAMNEWIKGSAYGWVFDNPEDTLTLEQRVFGYDMTEVFEDEISKSVICMYLIHRHMKMMDGRKTIWHFDEGWALLDDEYFEKKIEDLQLTIRKKEGLTTFGTQMPDHILSSKAGLAVLNQSATNVFSGNPKASRDTYIKGFKVTEREYDLIKNVLPHTRKYLVRHGSESVVIDFNLYPLINYIPLLSSRASYIEKLENILELHGSDPNIWVHKYLEEVNK